MSLEDDLKEIAALKEKVTEQQAKQEAETLGLFNINDFAGSTETVQSITIPKLGEVRFKLLSYSELAEINKKLDEKKIFDLADRGVEIIAAMLHKADGVSTSEKVKSLPGAAANRLVNVLSEKAGFL